MTSYTAQLHDLSEKKKLYFAMAKKNPQNYRFFYDKGEEIKKQIDNLHTLKQCRI